MPSDQSSSTHNANLAKIHNAAYSVSILGFITIIILCVTDDTDGSANISTDLRQEIVKLSEMVNGLHDIGKAFYNCLVTMTYESLSEVQKKVYDQVMKIVPHITSTDILVRCLFHSQSIQIPKNTEADVIKVLGTENLVFQKVLLLVF